MKFRCAALNTGSDYHLLDHIAPLAKILDMPLILTEEQNYDLAKAYYPQIASEYEPNLEFKLGEIAQRFDALFECKYWAPHLKLLFEQLFGKTMRLIFCPHGQSDKGFKAPLLAPYAQQDAVLLYGDLMIEMLKQLDVWSYINHYARIGNYRLIFYETHRHFYDEIAYEKVFSKLDPKKRTLFYAPTWADADKSTSFFAFGKRVIDELPDDWNLLIKPHPLLEQRNPAEYYTTVTLADKSDNICLVSDFPPIYPLIAGTDAYLGDFSSIGYDFLHFDKPLFFLPSCESGRIHQCGTVLSGNINLYLEIERSANNLYLSKRKELCDFAFGKNLLPHEVRENIFALLSGDRRENK